MKNQRFSRWGLLLLVAVLALPGAAPPARAGDFDDFVQEVTGPLAVDDLHGTATVGEQLLFVGPAAHLEIEGQFVDFETLAAFAEEFPGSMARARFVLIGEDAYALEIVVGEGVGEEVEVTGLLVVFDPLELSIGIIPDGQTDPVLLGIDLGTEFVIDVAELSLDLLLQLLQPGASIHVRARYDPDTLIASEVEFILVLDETAGSVQALNARTGAMTVKRKRGAPLSVQLLPGTVIVGPSGPMSASQIRRGDQVQVSFFTSRRKRVASRVRVSRSRR